MRVIRRSRIPAIYLAIPWIRRSKRGFTSWVDCIEDADYTLKMQAICKGEKCLSVFDRLNDFLVIGDFPDNWNEFTCRSGEVGRFRASRWKVWDVLYLLDNSKPAEAITLTEAGLSNILLESLSRPDSCIPILTTLRQDLEFADLTEQKIKEIENLEKSLFRELRIKQLKGGEYMGLSHKKPKANVTRKTSLSLRKRILARDGYRCILCGSASEQDQLEVDHIIPVSLICRLGLSRVLLDAEYNLWTSCMQCNRGKRDNLSPDEISYYIQSFDNPSHPNHGILAFLLRIRDLQQAGET
jgi:hypothetical protein